MWGKVHREEEEEGGDKGKRFRKRSASTLLEDEGTKGRLLLVASGDASMSQGYSNARSRDADSPIGVPCRPIPCADGGRTIRLSG